MIIIADIRHLKCGLDTKTEDIQLEHIKMSSEKIHAAHLIVATNGKELKILKYRGTQSSRIFTTGTYSINMLPILVYFVQESMEQGSVNLYKWVEMLSGSLNSKQLSELSKKFEKRAVEIA